MDQILRELAELLLKAVPTFLLVGLLYLYLKWMFFRPLERVLEARRQATEGTRKLAEQTLTKASAQAAHYQAALQAARAEIYREQEEARRRWQEERAAAVQEAKQTAERMIEESVGRLRTEVAEAKRALELQAGSLAARMVERVLGRRAV